MADRPTDQDDKLPDDQAEDRFNRTLGNLVNMAPAPRKASDAKKGSGHHRSGAELKPKP